MARNGEPIKTGSDGILNFDQSKMLFPVMCHLMYIDTTIFTKISDYATAVFSVHSMMHPLKGEVNTKKIFFVTVQVKPNKKPKRLENSQLLRKT